MNRLPKYWVVKNDGSQFYKDTVIAYMNTIYDCWTGTSRKYYGYDGSEDYGGTNVFNNIKDFQNNPTVLTIEQFIEMTKEETTKVEEFKKGEMVYTSFTKVEFICDLGETDKEGDRYVIKNNGYYYLVKNIRKIEPTIEIKGKKYRIKDIEENLNPLD